MDTDEQTTFLEIDGSYLEGGGQILRDALSFSCILQKPIRVTNIRANRRNPGLSNQHLYGLNLLQQITSASVRGNFIRSTTIEFSPRNINFGYFTIDTRTAASISLVAQSALPVLLFAGGSSKLEIIGGTNVGMAPQVDFLTEILWPNLEKFGAAFEFDLIRRGYYPRGGGRCKFQISPINKISAADITEFGCLDSICGWCFVAGRIPDKLSRDIKMNVLDELQSIKCPDVNIEDYKESPFIVTDNGSGVILKAITDKKCVLGASSLGEKTVDPLNLAKQATIELKEIIQRKSCVDKYVQDQLIIFMALADGTSKIQTCEITDHTKTAIHVAELMTGVKFEISSDNENFIIECTGCGTKNRFI